MEKTIKYKERNVNYIVEGTGETLLFLHGYLESSNIWLDFILRFVKTYKVICLDIPGHGKSDVLGPVHTMAEMADVAYAVLESESVNSVTVFGHSMGGYITMEFVNNYPQMIKGYCLFHSTCFADNNEKKLNRDREISLVLCGKKMQIIHTNIPKAFADSNINHLEESVSIAKQIAKECPEAGIVALLRGMKERNDLSGILKNNAFSPLIIWGEKDNYIGKDTFDKLRSLAPHAPVIVLKESGHMGFVEEPDFVYSGIMNYLDSLK